MFEYRHSQRRPLVLVWADGTIAVDKPYGEDEPLREYLMYVHTSHFSPGEVPTAIYAHCAFCGHLHNCRIDKVDQTIEDDWIYVTFKVVAVVKQSDASALPFGGSLIHGRDPEHNNQEVTSITIRFDGRA